MVPQRLFGLMPKNIQIKSERTSIPTVSYTHLDVYKRQFAYKHEDFLRIYFSSRDAQGQSRPTFIDVEYDDPSKILYIHDKPVLELGGPGEYDETGAMPAWFVDRPNGDIWLYYTGWNRTCLL